MQGDRGWDLLAALDFIKGHPEHSQEDQSLTAVHFLESRMRKVNASRSIRCISIQMRGHFTRFFLQEMPRSCAITCLQSHQLL